MYRCTVLLYTICTDELYFCAHNSYKRDTHTWKLHFIYLYSCSDTPHYCTQLVQMDCTSVCKTVLLSVQLYTALQLDTTYTHLWRCTNSAVCCYCTPVSLHLYNKLILTNESQSRITFMNRVDQSQLRFLSVHDLTHSLNCCMLSAALVPHRTGRGKK